MAICEIGRRELSSSDIASAIRIWLRYCLGDLPSDCLKSLLKCVGLRLHTSARAEGLSLSPRVLAIISSAFSRRPKVSESAPVSRSDFMRESWNSRRISEASRASLATILSLRKGAFPSRSSTSFLIREHISGCVSFAMTLLKSEPPKSDMSAKSASMKAGVRSFSKSK